MKCLTVYNRLKKAILACVCVCGSQMQSGQWVTLTFDLAFR